jgi:glutamate dehydrogenase/leucine dehydrogenase
VLFDIYKGDDQMALETLEHSRDEAFGILEYSEARRRDIIASTEAVKIDLGKLYIPRDDEIYLSDPDILADPDATPQLLEYYTTLAQASLQGREAIYCRSGTGHPGKGGMSFRGFAHISEFFATGFELGTEMEYKEKLLRMANLLLSTSRGTMRQPLRPFDGAKVIVNENFGDRPAWQANFVIAQLAFLLHTKGLLDHEKYVGAGDISTSAHIDTFANVAKLLQPNNRFNGALVTGKSPANQGLYVRGESTGLVGFETQLAVMDHLGIDVARTAVQGAGFAGIHFARSAGENKRTILNAIGEIGGTLVTKDSAGFFITEDMVGIGEDPDLRGAAKLEALREAIEKNQRGLKFEVVDTDVRFIDTDFLTLAAVKNVITGENIRKLGAKIGANEIANGATTLEAHLINEAGGLLVLNPDINASGGGLHGSVREHQTNLRQVEDPEHRADEKDIREELVDAAHHRTGKIMRIADEHNTSPRTAAVMLALENMAA